MAPVAADHRPDRTNPTNFFQKWRSCRALVSPAGFDPPVHARERLLKLGAKSFGTQRFRFAVVNTGLTPFAPWSRMALAMLVRALFIG